MKNPWFKFYPSDWRSDPSLRVCSLAARGLWLEMLCVMHEAEPRGTLRVNGNPMTHDQLAALVGVPTRDVQRCLDELESAGVFSRDDNRVIYSRRMVRDTEKAIQDKARGRLGGNPKLKLGVNPHDNKDDKAHIPEARKGSDTIVSGASAPRATIDPRSILFDEGLPLLVSLTDKPPDKLRPILGRWLKLTANDAGAILAEIDKCRATPVADPIAWIERQLKPQEARHERNNQRGSNLAALAEIVIERADARRNGLDVASVDDADPGSAAGHHEPPASLEIPAYLRRF